MKFCEELKTRQKMQKFIDLKDKKNFVKTYIQPMMKLGMIEVTTPDKPNSQNQQYVAAC